MAVSVMLILWYIVFAYKVFGSTKFTFFICVKGFDSSAIWAAGSSS